MVSTPHPAKAKYTDTSEMFSFIGNIFWFFVSVFYKFFFFLILCGKKTKPGNGSSSAKIMEYYRADKTIFDNLDIFSHKNRTFLSFFFKQKPAPEIKSIAIQSYLW